MNIGILNYTVGNIKNLSDFIESMDYKITIIDDQNLNIMESLDGLVFPGVGAFNTAMDFIDKHNIKKNIFNMISNNKPILGICLGFQIMFNQSSENNISKGLGIFDGEVLKLDLFNHFDQQSVPHIGWNNIEEISTKQGFYFLHSFAVEKLINNEDVDVYFTDYSKLKFISLIKKNNIMGTQFHPERSDKNGYKLIKEFFANYEKI